MLLGLNVKNQSQILFSPSKGSSGKMNQLQLHVPTWMNFTKSTEPKKKKKQLLKMHIAVYHQYEPEDAQEKPVFRGIDAYVLKA